ncbi:MAG: hypothetical protein KF862_07235 [Chitinophagaceae bacterium]|nr:hypothetical protein [Chitinophagaceae bacterium]
MRASELRPVDIYYHKDVAAGATTAKAHNHTGSYGDSGKIELTYVTHVEKIQLPRKIAQNNVVTYQNMFNNLYEMKWKNLRTRHDTTALAFLYANRCQLSAGAVNAEIASANPGTWEDTSYSLFIDADRRSVFAQKIKSFMMARKFLPEYDIVADLQQADAFEYAMNQASGNAVNTSFQFNGLNISRTQDVVSSTYTNGAVLIMPAGALSAMPWNDPLNRSGVNSGENEVGMLGTVSDPFGSGSVADISMYTQRADTSANTTGGSTQDIVDEWEIALTIAYALPPLSAAGDSVVHLVGQGS